jgi:periplasmic protein TonB
VRTILAVAALAAALAVSAAAQSKPYKVGQEGVKSPVIIREVKPQYTRDAMERKVQGTVEIKTVVLTDGKVGAVEVTKPLDPDLDQAAIDALKQWIFRPGTKDDKPVEVEISVELTFTLR